MNEYTEFDTATEMQKALDRKKAAYGVPYAPLLETCEIDADGIIRDTVRVTRTSGELHTLCTYQHNLAVTCNECTGSHPSGGSRVGVAYKQFIEQEAYITAETKRGQDAWDSDDVFDFDAQSVYFQEAYKEAWFETVRPNTDGDNCEQAWGHQLDDLYWRFKEQEDKKVNALIAKDERPSFQPSTAELAMFLIFFFLCLGISIDTVMKGDRAAVRVEEFREMAPVHLESGVGSER